MPWPEVFLVLLVSHLVGDFLIQTDHQALHKRHGIAAGAPMRALLTHVVTYTLAFLPALVWLFDDLGAAVLLVAAYLFVTHAMIDDARLLEGYMRVAKGRGSLEQSGVVFMVDQSFHVLTLFALALLIAA